MFRERIENRIANDCKNTFADNNNRLFDPRNFVVEENDECTNEGVDKSDLVNSKTINDILKYGAHQSVDSNPVETQSEWSDDDDRDDDEAKGIHLFFEHELEHKYNLVNLCVKGGAESTGYITDEAGLENLSLLNETGLTDAEGALSDVNSCNAHDVDDTSISSRASSRLLSLDSLSGFYDNDQDPVTSKTHEKAIMNVSSKITNKFGSQAL